MPFKRKTVYMIVCVGTYGDSDTIEYIAESKEIADWYIDYCKQHWPELTYRLESIDMIIDDI